MIQLSIITINFNNKEGLERSIESILSKKSSEIEYILIDAESTDGSQDVIAKYRSEIDQVVIEKDKGIYDGMNKGILLANGQYLIFINSGDQLGDLDVILNLLKSGVDAYYGATKVNYSNGFQRLDPPRAIDDLWKGLPFVHQSLIVKTSIHQNNLFDLKYTFCSDYELVCRLYSSGLKFEMTQLQISSVEAGGLSDEKRVEATNEVEGISDHYFKLTEEKRTYFRKRNEAGSKAQKLKKILPPFIVKWALKWKYRK